MNDEPKTMAEDCTLGWRCFHCGEHFHTYGGAQDHFGNYINSTPGCIVKVQVGDERGWLMELRKLQEENAHLRQQMNEEYWSQTAFNAHLKTHIQSYRPFRKCESLQDVYHVFDSMEGRALAAEEKISDIPHINVLLQSWEEIRITQRSTRLIRQNGAAEESVGRKGEPSFALAELVAEARKGHQ